MNIGIIGLGLIGGSIALDLRQASDYTLLAVSRRAETCEQAIARGIVDDASTDLSLMQKADVIFLCTPIEAIEPTVKQLIPYLNPTTILTDVGSVKKSIVDAIAPIWPNFVGGHPMAGTAEQGLDAAQRRLFVGKAYVLTPIASTPATAVATVTQVVELLRPRLYHCDPADHDRAVAWISHLPLMVSANLISTCMSESDANVLQLAQAFASSGFRDTSRVGGGNPELGVMIARYNQTALLRSLYAYRDQIEHLIQQIERSDWDALEAQLHQTHRDRPKFVDL
jgi:arogenate dehydrogenase (NADP+)